MIDKLNIITTKGFIIILFIVINITCSFVYSQEIGLLKEFKLDYLDQNNIVLTNNLKLQIKPDSGFINDIITFTRDEKVIFIDSLEITSEGFNFRLFEIKERKEFLLIIESIYEFASFYPLYLINTDKILQIGYLNIRLDCSECDSYNYPIEDIIVKGNENKIEFIFKKDFEIITEDNSFKKKNEESMFVYDIINNKLIFKDSTKVEAW